jgi:L-ascorbate metabolism protein UlaG (beta-lactamase superfamily)
MSEAGTTGARRGGRGWWRYTLMGTGALAAAAALVTWTSTSGLETLGTAPQGERLKRMQASPRFKEGLFVNPNVSPVGRTGMGWSTTRAWLLGDEQRTPPGPLPLRQDAAKAWAQPPQSGLRVTWLGHSTLLVEVDGVRLLTDPVWGERASPSTVVGPQRFHPPPVALEELPPLDAVLLSHDHYDHLDMGTIRALNARGVTFYVPLGVGAHMEGWGVPPERIVELDWWQEVALGGNGFKLVATPAHHFSGRSLTDRNRTLWASWTLLGPTHRVFFSGDTGMTPDFTEIGQRFGPFDLTMLEVGAYHPSWGDIHLGPHHALEAHAMLKGRRMLPVHWGTFMLAMHAWDEPAETLEREARARQVELVTPILGQPVEPTRSAAAESWWREVRAAP